jgi:hypothetical protein
LDASASNGVSRYTFKASPFWHGLIPEFQKPNRAAQTVWEAPLRGMLYVGHQVDSNNANSDLKYHTSSGFSPFLAVPVPS